MTLHIGIVDVSSVFYPQWHAGLAKPIGFAYDGTIQRVRRFASGPYDIIVIACDSGRSFRHDLSSRYKAHRDEPDATLLAQLAEVQKTLDADGYHVLKADGFEADDIVATVTTWAVASQLEVTILSSDKDLLALVSPHVRVEGVTSGATLGPDEVLDKWGVHPAQMRDLLALMGDTADGVSGVKGVGKVKAAELLKTFGDIDGIRAALDNDAVTWQPATYTALSEAFGDGSLDLSRRLVTLRDDVPIDCAVLLQPKEVKPLRPDFGADMPPDEEDMTENVTTEVQQGGSVVQVQETQQVHAPKEDRPPDESTVERIMSQVQPVEWTRQLEPRGWRDTAWVAGKLHESRLLAGPEARDGDLAGKSGYGSPEQIFAVIMAGRELGLGAMSSLRGINIIRGKVSMSAALMVGLCLARGAEYFDLVESTPEHATYETKRRGQSRVLTMTYTLGQAKAFGLYPGKKDRFGNPSMWEKDPANMLAQRCGARAARAFYPHIVMGVYLPDELTDD